MNQQSPVSSTFYIWRKKVDIFSAKCQTFFAVSAHFLLVFRNSFFSNLKGHRKRFLFSSQNDCKHFHSIFAFHLSFSKTKTRQKKPSEPKIHFGLQHLFLIKLVFKENKCQNVPRFARRNMQVNLQLALTKFSSSEHLVASELKKSAAPGLENVEMSNCCHLSQHSYSDMPMRSPPVKTVSNSA